MIAIINDSPMATESWERKIGKKNALTFFNPSKALLELQNSNEDISHFIIDRWFVGKDLRGDISVSTLREKYPRATFIVSSMSFSNDTPEPAGEKNFDFRKNGEPLSLDELMRWVK